MNQHVATMPQPLLSRKFWVGLVLGAGVVLTSLTGLVIGWFAVALQFFGASADADDYRMTAGAYGTAALVLALGAVAVRTWRAPTWELVIACAGAGLLALLSVDALSQAAEAEPGDGYGSWIDGAGGVIACPWTWPLVVLGIWGPVRGWLRRDFPATRT